MIVFFRVIGLLRRLAVHRRFGLVTEYMEMFRDPKPQVNVEGLGVTLPIPEVRGRCSFPGCGGGGQGLHVEIRHVFDVTYLANLEYSTNPVS